MIKYFVMDVDGTLTDGKIYMGADGEFVKAFDIKDGCGIHDLLIPSGIVPVIITGRTSQIVRNRCRELGITALYQGISNKKEKLEEILRENGDSCLNVAYIGDDINDLECMQEVLLNGGVVGCPPGCCRGSKKYCIICQQQRWGCRSCQRFYRMGVEEVRVEWMVI